MGPALQKCAVRERHVDNTDGDVQWRILAAPELICEELAQRERLQRLRIYQICEKPNKPFRVPPEQAETYCYWKSPFLPGCKRLECHPDVLHLFPKVYTMNIVEKSLYQHLEHNYYITKSGAVDLNPHWLKNYFGKTLRVYLRPNDQQNRQFQRFPEVRILTKKIRYIDISMKKDEELSNKCYITIQENHGGLYMKKRRKCRPLRITTIIVDHQTPSIIMQGEEFYLILNQTCTAEQVDHVDDPGGLLDIGGYYRDLDTHPDIAIMFNVCVRSRDLPPSVVANYLRSVSIRDLLRE
ncbi:hypothetical protein CHS0354_021668 [Potamilus streckersoni]|uniref:Uncharacterized protein n=1 Tax=Potamilus streckersoni TaxID=2493646 RepID=A0AAE0SPC9_9BIVA|nr:hypothetical protein CHS0354_021668 [Potamilus streckersoni]